MAAIEKQFCTAMQAELLHKHGVQQLSMYYWSTLGAEQGQMRLYRRHRRGLYNDHSGDFDAFHFPMPDYLKTFSAYSVAELGAMLQKETQQCFFHNPSKQWSHSRTIWDTQAECYADRLIMILERDTTKYYVRALKQRLRNLHEE